MGTLGSYLRTAREARGLDLRDVAQQTRISISFLKAIEEEEFSKLPGKVFVKGFLKNYARFLRLPEDEVMKRYGELGAPKAASPSPPAPSAPTVEQQKPLPPDTHDSGPEPAGAGKVGLEPFLWAGAVIIGLVVFILTALPGRDRGHKPADGPASKVSETGQVQTSPTPTALPEKLYLDIVALEDVWVLVRIDASPQKKAALKKDESVTWSANERFLLSYSSVGAAKLVLNGKELVVNGPKNAVVRDLIITSAGVAFQKMEAEKPKPHKPKTATQTTTTGPQSSPPLQVQPPAQQGQPSPAPAGQVIPGAPGGAAAPSFPAPRE